MITQNTVIQTSEVSEPSPSRKMPPTSAPPTIHGVRRPKRERVRSLNAPTIGWANRVKTNETVVTIARFATLFSSSSVAIWTGSRITIEAAVGGEEGQRGDEDAGEERLGGRWALRRLAGMGAVAEIAPVGARVSAGSPVMGDSKDMGTPLR